MSVLAVHNISKRYGKHYAVQDVSFSIEQGEIVGFLGPNGAGKTTTLRMLAGLIYPSSGHAKVLGGKTPGPQLARVGTMIEEPSFYPYMSGQGNLHHAALLHGNVPPARIPEVLEFVGMNKAAQKKVRAYSQGMRQRLGLARALLWRPKVLLLDEPTNGLDPVGIAEFRESLREIAASEGVTILVSSHILAELEKLVSRILVIEKGHLLYDDTLTNLTRRLSGQQVTYRLAATDQSALMNALDAKGLQSERLDDELVRVSVLADEHSFLSGLAMEGIHLLEAHREYENLEQAYLRLLKEDGKPL